MAFTMFSEKLQKLIEKKGFMEPTLPQKMGIPDIVAGNDVLIIAPTGSGKCVAGDTLILTEDGLNRIDTLFRKQIITNTLSNDLKITLGKGAIIRKKKSKIYNLETNTGRKIKVTDDHKFLTIVNGELKWKMLKDLKTSDYIACTRKLYLQEKNVKITLNLLHEWKDKLSVKTNPGVKEILEKIKKNEGKGTRKVAREIGCHRHTLQYLKVEKRSRILIKILEKLADMAGISHSSIEVLEIGTPGGIPLSVPEINDEFAYFLGLFSGDGNFNQKRTIRFSNGSEVILKFFKDYCKKNGLELKKDNSKRYDYFVARKSMYVLLKALGLPDKDKSTNLSIPKILFSKYSLLSSFLRGLYDTDGSVYKNNIELCTKSEKLSNEVNIALQCFGIIASIKEKKVQNCYYKRLIIQNVKNFEKFHKNIGFLDNNKNNRLLSMLNRKSNPNLDIIPEIEPLLKNCRYKLNVPYSREHYYRLYESYIQGRRNPSRQNLLGVLDFFAGELEQNEPEELILLRRLGESDIFWDKIIEIKETGKDFVYDATIPNTHNFIGNGIVLHNTEAACLPLFDKIIKNNDKPISILYVNPLRSLSRDLLDRLFWWADKLDIEVSVRYGDTMQQERRAQADQPPHCLITTPETLASLLIGKKMRENLKNVKYVIIDEIHEIVENKRGIQLSILLERLKCIAGNFQRIGISATVGEPEKVAAFLSKNAKIINAIGSKSYEIKVEFPKPRPEHTEKAGTLFISDSTVARMMRLKELIDTHTGVITFTNTRETAEILSSRFRVLDKDMKQEVHHGSLSKESRIESEKNFKLQKLKSLIATSSLELGIDIGSVDLVVQYLSPRQVSKFIQRMGRSGHGVGRKSKGVILTGDEDVFESAVIARKAGAGEIENIKIHDAALDVLATQITGMALEKYDIHSKEIFETINRAYPYRNLTIDEFENVLKFLGALRLVWLTPAGNGDFLVRRSRRSWEYYYANLSTIPDTRQMKIVSIVQNEPIGVLDEAFIAEHCEPGKTFICKGMAWKVLRVEENKVTVEPVVDMESAIPAWEGEIIPVPYSVAKEVGELRHLAERGETERIRSIYHADKNAAEEMISIAQKNKIIPDSRHFFIETHKDFIILHSCAGTLINDTIGRYVSAVLTAETGVAVNMKTDPYRIIFQCKAAPKDIKRILEHADKLEETIKLSIERSSLFKYRFIHVCKRFGIISRNARLDRIGISRIVSQYSGTPAYKETMREVVTDKMDIEGAKSTLEKIRKKEVKITIIPDKLSYFGELGLSRSFSDVMKPRMPEGEIYEAFKRRLLATTIRILCTNCADFTMLIQINSIDEQPRCPKCNSGFIAICSRHRNPLNLLKKYKQKIKLAKEEEKEIKDLKRSASLVITYGKKYTTVQAGHGIGVETAARVLARLPKDEEQLLRYIFEAEKEYARTRQYWKA